VSKKVDQHIDFLEYLAAHPNGVSYAQLMNEFRCGRSTVYRRLSVVRSRYFGVLEEKIAENGETLFFLRKSLSKNMTSISYGSDEATLWSLHFGAQILRELGLDHHSRNIGAVAATLTDRLKATLRIDQRKALDDMVGKCAVREQFNATQSDGVNSMVVSQLCLALHAIRPVTIVLESGQKFSGVPVSLTHELGQSARVTMRSANGDYFVCHAEDVKKVLGIDDLVVGEFGLAA
jgi:hypothetical protein